MRMSLTLLCLMLSGVSTAPPALAEEQSPARSRKEIWKRLREAKREEVEPYQRNRVEEQFLRMDKAETPTIADWNFKGLYPRVSWPSRGSGAAVGARYWQPDLLGPLDLAGAAFYSWRHYQHYDVQFGLLPHRGDQIPARSWKGDDLYEIGDVKPGFPRFPLYVTFRYRNLPEEDFFGLGPDSSMDERVSYLQEETRVYLRTGLQLTRNFVWILEGGYQSNSLGPSRSAGFPSVEELFDDDRAPALGGAPNYVRAGTQLFLDFRDEPGNPHKGFMFALLGERFADRSRGNFSFVRLGFDARGYLPLGSPQRVLALRAALLFDEPDENHRVPFFMQESLGGSHTLRGFDSFRWRAEKIALYQLEYRWEPTSFWELAVFTDAGSVARTDTNFSKLEWDYGFGMRFKSYRDIVLRLEIAFSRETTRYFIRSSASF